MHSTGAPGAPGAPGAQGAAGAQGAQGAAGAVRMPQRLVVLAPNWLGDAVMALPLLRDLRRAWAATEIVVAARQAVEPLYSMVPDVNSTLVLEGGGGRKAVASLRTNTAQLAAGNFEAALLLPNSFAAAWLVRSAGIKERWGYSRDLRGRLLTHAHRLTLHLPAAWPWATVLATAFTRLWRLPTPG